MIVKKFYLVVIMFLKIIIKKCGVKKQNQFPSKFELDYATVNIYQWSIAI